MHNFYHMKSSCSLPDALSYFIFLSVFAGRTWSERTTWVNWPSWAKGGECYETLIGCIPLILYIFVI